MQGFNTDCFIFNQSNCKVNLSNLADKRQIDHRVIKTYRGMIYDRNGEILAMSLPKKTLCINIFQTRKMLKNENINYSKLLKLIGMPKKKFQNLLEYHSEKDL